MLNEKCYGVLSDENLIFVPNILKKDLESHFINAIHNGVNSFIIGANNEFDNITFKTCKHLQKRYKSKNISIKIVLTDIDIIKNPEQYQILLQKYANEQLIYIYAESQTLEEKTFLTRQFIVNNSHKCFAYIDDKNITKFNKLSAYPYIIINLYNNEEYSFKKDIIWVEKFNENDLKKITLYN